jgi:adenine-specific DNA-methyltransferase
LEHSQWLSMMFPRLVLLRDLLAEDGSIWVTIDDNEGHYLKVLMDEVFGRGSFITNIVWQKKYAVKNDSEFFSESHDHILVYRRNKFLLNRELRSDEQKGRYLNIDGDRRGPWTSGPLQRNEFREYAYYAIRSPSGREFLPPRGTSWRYTRERMDQLIADNRIYFGPQGNNVPRLKRFLTEVSQYVAPTTWWDYKQSGHNDEARRESKALADAAELFATPNLVLDSFLGSGTTAAVAHKMGRRWIGIEMGEHARTHCLPRLEKVIEGEQGGISQAVRWQGGGGFRFLRLGEPMFGADGHIHASVRFATLASFIWMQETGRTMAGPWNSPLLGVHEDRAIYLLFNGILHDLRPDSGNVLTGDVLTAINHVLPHAGPKVVYGEACRLGAARLSDSGITFKQLPYDVQAR